MQDRKKDDQAWVGQPFFNTHKHNLLRLSSVRGKKVYALCCNRKGSSCILTSDLLIPDKPGPPNKAQFPLELHNAFTGSTGFIFNKRSLRWGPFQKVTLVFLVHQIKLRTAGSCPGQRSGAASQYFHNIKESLFVQARTFFKYKCRLIN